MRICPLPLDYLQSDWLREAWLSEEPDTASSVLTAVLLCLRENSVEEIDIITEEEALTWLLNVFFWSDQNHNVSLSQLCLSTRLLLGLFFFCDYRHHKMQKLHQLLLCGAVWSSLFNIFHSVSEVITLHACF